MMKLSINNTIISGLSLSMIVVSITEITGLSNFFSSQDTFKILNIPSIGIVIGGILFHAVLSFSVESLKQTLLMARYLFSHSVLNDETYKSDISLFLKWQQEIKMNKNTARTELIKRLEDSFEGYVMMLTSTNYTIDEIRKISRTKAVERYTKQLNISKIYYKLAESAPAFGMLGTLIGLIMMLSNFESVSELGKGLSFALMTTLYGLVLAHTILLPLANKSDILAEQQFKRDLFKLNGILMIHEGAEPLAVFDHMCANRDGFVFDEELSEQLTMVE